MGWLVKPQKIYLFFFAAILSCGRFEGIFLRSPQTKVLGRSRIDLVASWLRSEIAKLTHVLTTIEEAHDYHDEYIHESLKTTEIGIRRIRKFIDAN